MVKSSKSGKIERSKKDIEDSSFETPIISDLTFSKIKSRQTTN